MKLRITPLNIIGAAGLGLAALTIFSYKEPVPKQLNMSGFYLLILACLVLVTFITDLIFRFMLKDLKRIWMVESIFIVFTVVLILIIQKLT